MTSLMDRDDLQRRQTSYKAMDKGASCVQSLKEALVRKYGTITSAWKHGLDVHGNGRVPFGEFCAAMRRLGFSGNTRRIFNELDVRQSGAITLMDFDAEAHQLLVDFRKVLLEKFGSYIKAWQALDSNRNGVLEEHELV